MVAGPAVASGVGEGEGGHPEPFGVGQRPGDHVQFIRLDAVAPLVLAQFEVGASWRQHGDQADLLDEILAGDLIPANELPEPTPAERKVPKTIKRDFSTAQEEMF